MLSAKQAREPLVPF